MWRPAPATRAPHWRAAHTLKGTSMTFGAAELAGPSASRGGCGRGEGISVLSLPVIDGIEGGMGCACAPSCWTYGDGHGLTPPGGTQRSPMTPGPERLIELVGRRLRDALDADLVCVALLEEGPVAVVRMDSDGRPTDRSRAAAGLIDSAAAGARPTDRRADRRRGDEAMEASHARGDREGPRPAPRRDRRRKVADPFAERSTARRSPSTMRRTSFPPSRRPASLRTRSRSRGNPKTVATDARLPVEAGGPDRPSRRAAPGGALDSAPEHVIQGRRLVIVWWPRREVREAIRRRDRPRRPDEPDHPRS